MARKAGTLAVAITANSTAFDRTLARTQRNVANFASGVKGALAGVGIAFGAKALLGAGKSFVDTLDGIGKRAGVLKVSTERYQQFSYAAERTGTAIGTVESAVTRVNNVLAKGAAGDKAAAASFNLIGLSVKDLKDLRPDEVFDRVAEALATMNDPAAKNLAILELFGKSGQELNNFLKDYIALGEEAKANGSIIGEESVRAAEKINDQLTTMNKQILTIVSSLGILQKAADALDLTKYFGSDDFWKSFGLETMRFFGFGGFADDIARHQDNNRYFSGAITQAEVAAANAARAKRIADKQAGAAAAAERAARTRAELERRRAAAAEKTARAGKAAKVPPPEKLPTSQVAGSFSLSALAQMITGGTPADRTATATEKLLQQATEQTALQKTIAEKVEKPLSIAAPELPKLEVEQPKLTVDVPELPKLEVEQPTQKAVPPTAEKPQTWMSRIADAADFIFEGGYIGRRLFEKAPVFPTGDDVISRLIPSYGDVARKATDLMMLDLEDSGFSQPKAPPIAVERSALPLLDVIAVKLDSVAAMADGMREGITAEPGSIMQAAAQGFADTIHGDKILDLLTKLLNAAAEQTPLGMPDIPPLAVAMPDVPPLAVNMPDAPTVAMPDVPPLAVDVPELPALAVDVPELPALAVNVPDVPPLAVDVPELPALAVDVPKIPELPTAIPDVLATDLPQLPLDALAEKLDRASLPAAEMREGITAEPGSIMQAAAQGFAEKIHGDKILDLLTKLLNAAAEQTTLQRAIAADSAADTAPVYM